MYRPRKPVTIPSDKISLNSLSSANASTTKESFLSQGHDLIENGMPWSRVREAFETELGEKLQSGEFTFERKVDLYGEKIEELFKKLEERISSCDDDLIYKKREVARNLP